MFPELKSLPYEQRLDKLGLWTLEERRNRADLLEIFKLIKGFTAVSWTRFFTRIDNGTTRVHNWKLMKKHNCCDLRHHFFSQRALNHWNSMSVTGRSECIISQFIQKPPGEKETKEDGFLHGPLVPWLHGMVTDYHACEESLTRCSRPW